MDCIDHIDWRLLDRYILHMLLEKTKSLDTTWPLSDSVKKTFEQQVEGVDVVSNQTMRNHNTRNDH